MTYTMDELGFLYFNVNKAKKVKAEYLSGLSFFNFSEEKKTMKSNVKFLSDLLDKINYAIENKSTDYNFDDGNARVFATLALNFYKVMEGTPNDRAIVKGIIEKMPR